MTLQEQYEKVCAEPSDIYEHLPTMVELVEELEARTVIELGTRTGVSTIAWLYGLMQTDGMLWSVDIDEKPPIGSFHHWRFIQGDDMDPSVYARLPEADIVFIDTSHAYNHTLQELNLYKWLVRPGGVIVCHDTELERPMDVGPGPAFPVKKAITEFCAAEGLEWENHPNCWGLGVIRVR